MSYGCIFTAQCILTSIILLSNEVDLTLSRLTPDANSPYVRGRGRLRATIIIIPNNHSGIKSSTIYCIPEKTLFSDLVSFITFINTICNTEIAKSAYSVHCQYPPHKMQEPK